MLGAEGDKPAGKSGKGKGKAAQTGKKTAPKKRKENQAKAPQPDQLLEALERAATSQVDREVSEQQVGEPVPEKVSAPKEAIAPAEVVSPAEAIAPAEVTSPAETIAPAEVTSPPETVAPAEVTSPPETIAPAEIVASAEFSAPAAIVAPVTFVENVATETPVVETPAIAAAEPARTTPVSLRTLAEAYADYSRKSFEQTSCFVAKLAGAGSLAKALELQAAFAREAFETFVTQSQRIRELHGELAKQRLTRLEGLMSGLTQGAAKPTQKT